MKSRRLIIVLLVWPCLAAAARAFDNTIDVIDTFGLTNLRREVVLEAVGVKPGDPLPDDAQRAEIKRKLEALPGVKQATLAGVHCPGSLKEKAVSALYVGIQETDSHGPAHLPPPSGDVELPAEVLEQHHEFEKLFTTLVTAGGREDDSRGYALFGNESDYPVQEKFVALADRHHERLSEVLQTSKNAEHRAIAAWVIGYGSDKKRAADLLRAAQRDSDRVVRNNAIRALSVLRAYARKHPELGIKSYDDTLYFDMLESVDWTDRNKAVGALLESTKTRDEVVLNELRRRSLPSLAEMARWQYKGHAMMAAILLGRVADLSDKETCGMYDLGEVDRIITRALTSCPKQADEPVSKLNEPLKQELIAMFKADQDACQETLQALAAAGVTLDQQISRTDYRVWQVELTIGVQEFLLRVMHCNRLKAIVKEHGWPGKSFVGAGGAQAAWLLVQHADHDEAFQKRCLKLMEAMPEGEVDKSDIALLTDRTLVADGKPQWYGTQFGPGLVLRPIEDEAGVDARRKEMGLPPLAEYVEMAKMFYADPKQKQQAK